MAMCAACAHKDTTPETAAAPVAAEAAATPVERSVTMAQSVMKPGKNQKIRGIIHYTQMGDKVKIEGVLEKLKPGPHGLHIHDKGDCSAADFTSAGGHFNPTQATHGAMDSAEHHAGDLGNIVADRKGRAKISLEASALSMSGATNGIVGKSLVVHAAQDDYKTQPSGNSGDRVACGVIEANQ